MRVLVAVCVAVLLSGCVAGQEPVDVDSHTGAGGGFTVVDVHEDGCGVAPISEEEASRSFKGALFKAGGPPLTVFLNRHGGTYSPGANDSARNISSIVGGRRTVPAFERGDESWRQLVQCVREQYAPFNINITEVEPSGGNYVETVVGGWPGNIGVSNGIAGIAPIDTWNCRPMEKAVAYVFSRNIGSQRSLCEITAHEIGHTLSLEHLYLCEDPMTYLSGCGPKSFQDQEAWCGTYRAVQCACRGGQQNTVRALLDLVGSNSGDPVPQPEEDEGPPTVEILAPEGGSEHPENSTIEVIAQASDDQWLSKVELIWDFNGQTYGCPSTSQWVDCTQDEEAGTYTWRVQVGAGQRTFQVRAVDFVGNQAETDSRTIALTSGEPDEPGDQTPPTIAVFEPQDGEVRPPSSEVTVVAEVEDDVSLDNVQLLWAFNDQSYPCPSSSTYVECSVEGARHAWKIKVGVEGDRPFRIRAFDSAGNEATTETQNIEVRAVPDEVAPVVELIEPTPDQILPERSEITVAVRASDDISLASVELLWDFNAQTYACPLSSQYVDCTVEGDEHRWKLRVGVGTRTFRVRVKDAAGNTTTTDDRTYVLSSDAP